MPLTPEEKIQLDDHVISTSQLFNRPRLYNADSVVYGCIKARRLWRAHPDFPLQQKIWNISTIPGFETASKTTRHLAKAYIIEQFDQRDIKCRSHLRRPAYQLQGEIRIDAAGNRHYAL